MAAEDMDTTEVEALLIQNARLRLAIKTALKTIGEWPLSSQDTSQDAVKMAHIARSILSCLEGT